MTISRRTFLTGAVSLGAGAALSACTGRPAGPQHTSSQAGVSNSLTIPPVLAGTVNAAGERVFRLNAQEGLSSILPGLTTPTRGYNGSLLGPTLRASRGETVIVEFTNSLPDASTVHWHGMILPAKMDGGPHQMVAAGGSWSPRWKIDQPACTLWYHPHIHGTTAQQVYSGLAGMFLIDEPADSSAAIPHHYGVDDIPLIVQDKTFNADGTLDPATIPTFGIMGDVILVNGTPGAAFTASTTQVRFRILNGSNARMYHLEWSDGRQFQVVANDAGLLPKPVVTKRVSLSPAERVEIVVAIRPGDRMVLVTRSGNDDIDEGDFDILHVVAGARLTSSPALAPPAGLAGVAAPAASTHRTFELTGTTRSTDRRWT